MGHCPGVSMAETKGTGELVRERKGGLEGGADQRHLSFEISTMPSIQQVLKKIERVKSSVNLGTGMG